MHLQIQKEGICALPPRMKIIKKINNSLEYLCDNLEDSVAIILADHGHIDTKHYILEDYPNIKNMLER